MKKSVLIILFTLFLASNAYARDVSGLTVFGKAITDGRKTTLVKKGEVTFSNGKLIAEGKKFNITSAYSASGQMNPQKTLVKISNSPHVKFYFSDGSSTEDVYAFLRVYKKNGKYLIAPKTRKGGNFCYWLP